MTPSLAPGLAPGFTPVPQPVLPPAAPLRDLLLRQLRGGRPGLALRVLGTTPGARQSLLRCLLDDAAARGGGEVIEPGDGSLLMVGTATGAAGRAADQIDAIGALPAVERRELPRDTEAVLGWVAPVAAPPPPPPPAADIGTLDQLLGTELGPRLLRRRPILRLAAAAPARIVAERVMLCTQALAAALGPLAADPDAAAHAADLLAGWMVSQPEAAAAGIDPKLPAILPLPRSGLPNTPSIGNRVGLLPPAAAADPTALAARRAGLAALGWGLALGPIEAATLRVAEASAFAADLLLLRWSPALAEAGPLDALRTLDPRHLVLGGCTSAAAVAWGRALGIARFAGPAAEHPA